MGGLAFDCAIALDRDSVGDETGGRRLQLACVDFGFRLCLGDRVWLLWRACCHWYLTLRWVCWFASMSFFLYIIGTAKVMTVISWCTYPIAYLFPMLGISAAKAVV